VALVRIDGLDERNTEHGTLFLRSVLQLLVTANVPCWLILVTLMMVLIRSFETSVLTGATRRHIPEDDILHSDLRENVSLQVLIC
jgi:hypothetical protein